MLPTGASSELWKTNEKEEGQNVAESLSLGNVQFVGEPKALAALANKLAAICGGMTRVPKSGHNTAQNYDFAREADVVDHVRPELAARNLYMFFSSEPLSVSYEHRVSGKGNNQVWAQLELRATIVDGDSGAMFSFTMPGQAVDTGSDKAIFKAITGAKKYATMLAFNVATGDDPEDETRDTGRAKRERTPQDAADNAKREASKARQTICAAFPVMRDEARRDEICTTIYGKQLHEMDIQELKDLYRRLNRGEVGK